MTDPDLARKMAAAVGARPKQCYRNALQGAAWAGRGALYVEGWIVAPVPIEHSWIEIDGCIVDPTLPDLAEAAYHAGAKWTVPEALDDVQRETSSMRAGDLPIIWRYGWGGFAHEGYKAAFNEALAALNNVQDL